MSGRPQGVRLTPCPASCSTTATRRTNAASCSPRSTGTTARFATSQHSPRAVPADTRSGGPWTPPPKQKRSRCFRPTSLSGPPQPASAQSTFHDRLGPSPSRPKGATMTTFATQIVPPALTPRAPGQSPASPGLQPGRARLPDRRPAPLGDSAPLPPRRGGRPDLPGCAGQRDTLPGGPHRDDDLHPPDGRRHLSAPARRRGDRCVGQPDRACARSSSSTARGKCCRESASGFWPTSSTGSRRRNRR